MKNLQKLFSMAMLVCMAVAMFSCSKDEEGDLDVEVGIVGNWEIESTETLINGKSYEAYIEEAAQQAGMSVDALKDILGETLETEGTLSFMADKKFTGKIEGEETSGIWSVDGKKLLLDYEGEGEDEELFVKSLSANSAALSLTEVEGEGAAKVETEVVFHLNKK